MTRKLLDVIKAALFAAPLVVGGAALAQVSGPVDQQGNPAMGAPDRSGTPATPDLRAGW